MNEVKKTERGWGGHFICADRCLFRRNMLLEYGEINIVVSTVGLMRDPLTREITEISWQRYYETMVFMAHREGAYMDANVSEQVDIESDWCICAPSVKALPVDVDNRANDMHESVVDELVRRIESGEVFP